MSHVILCCGARGGRKNGDGGVEEDVPGNSVRETGERMNGGAVMDDKSPENDAILYSPTKK